MKLSILMTNYNEEKYIQMSIESVLENSFKNFELIVIDDGSNDSSVDIIKKYLDIDSRVKLYQNFTNMGVAHSKNLGLNYCRGDYIAMMDADDISLPNRFETQLRYMEENPEISICGGAMYLIFDQGTSLKMAITDKIEKKLMIQNPFNHPTIMIRRHLVDSGIFRYSQRFRHTEDYRLWTKLSYKVGMGNIDFPILLFRANKSVSNSNSAKSPLRREVELLTIRFLYLARLVRMRKCSVSDIKSFLATIVRSTIPSIYTVISHR